MRMILVHFLSHLEQEHKTAAVCFVPLKPAPLRLGESCGSYWAVADVGKGCKVSILSQEQRRRPPSLFIHANRPGEQVAQNALYF